MDRMYVNSCFAMVNHAMTADCCGVDAYPSQFAWQQLPALQRTEATLRERLERSLRAAVIGLASRIPTGAGTGPAKRRSKRTPDRGCRFAAPSARS
jgi:hypothetical protein